jgi:hypothetical protein
LSFLLAKIYKKLSGYNALKEKELLEEDSLTAYFMAKASGHKRRNKIISIRHEETLVQGDKELPEYATEDL